MKPVFVFLLILGPVFSFAQTVVGKDALPLFPESHDRRDTLSLPGLHKSVGQRDPLGFLQPDHMPCRYPQPALVERMPILRSGNADRMPNAFRRENPLRFNRLAPSRP